MARPQKWVGLGKMVQANVRVPVAIRDFLIAEYGTIQNAINELIIKPGALELERISATNPWHYSHP